MKKTLLILSIITLIFAGCKKFDEIEASKVEIVEEKIERNDRITFDVTYSYPVDLEAVDVYIADNVNMTNAKSYSCNVEGKKFSVSIDNVNFEKIYYCYEYDNGYEKERCGVGGLMIITTKEVTNIKVSTATCGGNIIYYGDDEITARGVCWSTSPNPTINDNKTTDGSGTDSYTSNISNLSENTTYYVRAYATNEKGTAYGEEKSFMTLPPTGTENGYGWVDLGLSVKWATCNVGASKPEEYGDYYAWGETTTKSNYSSSNSATYGLSTSQLQSQGYIDSNGNLTAQYDAATANWGGDWRMPTYDELNELRTKCTWTWTTQNGVNGYKVTSKTNSNYIFLPAAGFRDGSSLDSAGGYGYYWSSTSNGLSNGAYRLYFHSNLQGGDRPQPLLRSISAPSYRIKAKRMA